MYAESCRAREEGRRKEKTRVKQGGHALKTNGQRIAGAGFDVIAWNQRAFATEPVRLERARQATLVAEE